MRLASFLRSTGSDREFGAARDSSADIEKQIRKKLTFGERLSDRIAEFGGSWKFLSMTFGAVIVVWIGANAVLLATRAFDPYPFILLNLILSCLAAVQAPVIMMSQTVPRRVTVCARKNDYKVNFESRAGDSAFARENRSPVAPAVTIGYSRFSRSRSNYWKKSAAKRNSCLFLEGGSV